MFLPAFLLLFLQMIHLVKGGFARGLVFHKEQLIETPVGLALVLPSLCCLFLQQTPPGPHLEAASLADPAS